MRKLRYRVVFLFFVCLLGSGRLFAKTLEDLTAGLSIGVQGGLGILSVNNQETVNTALPIALTNYTEYAKNFGNAGIAESGIYLGYGIPLDNIVLKPSFTFNFLSGKVTTSYTFSSVPFIDKQTTQLQQQYSLSLSFEKLFNSNLGIYFGTGVSVLSVRSRYYVSSFQNDLISNFSSSETQYLWGPELSLGLQYYLSGHSSIGLTFNNDFYFKKALNNVYPNVTINSGGVDYRLDSTTGRSLKFTYIPAFMLEYAYKFS